MPEIILARLDDIPAVPVASIANTGSVGVGVFKGLVGTEAQFYKLNAASARASIVLSGTDRIDFDVVEAQILLQNLGGSLAGSQLAANAVTFAKFQQITSDRLVGRDTAGTGNVEEIAVSGGLEFSGAGAIQRSALTGDVTASAGSNATTIANDAVTFAKMQNITGPAVVGKAGAGAGDPAEISAGVDDRVFARASGTLSFQQVATAMVANSAITYAKIQNISATQRVVGRNSAGAGVAEEVTASQVLDWIGSTRGSILYRGASGWAILAPGTSGHALLSNGAGADPSYGAVTSGAIVLIERKNGSAVASYDFFTGFNAGHRTHIFEGWVAPATDDVEFWMRISDDGTTFEADAGDYRHNTFSYDDSGTARFRSSTSDTKMTPTTGDVSLAVGNAANERIRFFVRVTELAAPNLGWEVEHVAANGAGVQGKGGGRLIAATSPLGFQILFESGNIASGNVTHYVLRDV